MWLSLQACRSACSWIGWLRRHEMVSNFGHWCPSEELQVTAGGAAAASGLCCSACKDGVPATAAQVSGSCRGQVRQLGPDLRPTTATWRWHANEGCLPRRLAQSTVKLARQDGYVGGPGPWTGLALVAPACKAARGLRVYAQLLVHIF